jgi:hypothetical protein
VRLITGWLIWQACARCMIHTGIGLWLCDFTRVRGISSHFHDEVPMQRLCQDLLQKRWFEKTQRIRSWRRILFVWLRTHILFSPYVVIVHGWIIRFHCQIQCHSIYILWNKYVRVLRKRPFCWTFWSICPSLHINKLLHWLVSLHQSMTIKYKPI